MIGILIVPNRRNNMSIRLIADQIEGWTKETEEQKAEFTRLVVTKETREPKTFTERVHSAFGKVYVEEVEVIEPYTKVVTLELDTPMYLALKEAYFADKGEATTIAWVMSQKQGNTDLWKVLSGN